MAHFLKQAIILSGDHPCRGCEFRDEVNCEEVRPAECVEGDQHFVFVLDGSIEE